MNMANFIVLVLFALLRLGAAELFDPLLADDLESRQLTGHCVSGVHVIATRGSSTKDPPYGGLKTTVHNYTAAILHSNVVPNNYAVNSPFPPLAVQAGTERLKRMVRQYVARCPKSKIVLVGYSEGAVIMMNAICGYETPEMTHSPALDDKFAKNVIAAVAYGDESRQVGQPYNRGTCKGSGIRPRKQPKCGAFRPLIRSYCDAVDPYCCKGSKFRSHYAYPGKYDLKSTKFVVHQYDKKH